MTPIATATSTPGPPITVGDDPDAIAITPATAPQPPAIISRPADTAPFGQPYTFTITTTGAPVPWIGRTGRLPSGLHFTANHNGTATIAGTPAGGAAGTYPITVSARNNAGTTTQTFTLTVTRAPAIARLGTIRATADTRLHRVIHTRGYPAPALTATGTLPAGLSFTDKQNGTAVLTGTPAAGSCGRHGITIAAANPSGTAARRISILFKRHKDC